MGNSTDPVDVLEILISLECFGFNLYFRGIHGM